MILQIDTTKKDCIIVSIKNSNRLLVTKNIKAKYSQAEKLLPLIEKTLKECKILLSDIKEIEVVNKGENKTSFTSLRIGVITANALAFALGVPVKGNSGKEFNKKKYNFKIIKPIYYKEPNIT